MVPPLPPICPPYNGTRITMVIVSIAIVTVAMVAVVVLHQQYLNPLAEDASEKLGDMLGTGGLMPMLKIRQDLAKIMGEHMPTCVLVHMDTLPTIKIANKIWKET